MLSTLMRYDFKRLFKWVLPLCGGTLLSAGLFLLVFWRITSPTDYEVYAILGYAMLALLAILAMVGCYGAILVMVWRNFYKNLMSDEGYLTFTLPVTHNQILASKVISGSVCMVLGLFSLLASFYLLSFGMTAITGMYETLELGDMVESILPSSYLLVSILSGVVEAIVLVNEVYFAIVLGSAVAKVHKVWASIGFYAAISAGLGILSSIATFVYGFAALSIYGVDEMVTTLTVGYSLVTVAINVILCVVFYLLSLKLLRRKLNLQ